MAGLLSEVSMRLSLKLTEVISVLLFVSFQSSSAQIRNESSNDRKIVIESFVISGTQALDSAGLAEITNSMAGSTFTDDAEELQERVRAQFQDRGEGGSELDVVAGNYSHQRFFVTGFCGRSIIRALGRDAAPETHRKKGRLVQVGERAHGRSNVRRHSGGIQQKLKSECHTEL